MIAVGAEDTVETDLASGTKSGGDMAVGQRTDDGQGLTLGGNNGAAFEHAAQTCNMCDGPIGEVADGAFTDLTALPVARVNRHPYRYFQDIAGGQAEITADFGPETAALLASFPPCAPKARILLRIGGRHHQSDEITGIK